MPGLTEKSIKRIGNAVNKVERMPSDMVKWRRKRRKGRISKKRTFAFGCTLGNGNEVTARGGRYINHGGVNLQVTGATVYLAGASDEFVFVKYDRVNQTAEINHATTWPTSNSSYVYVILCSYENTAIGVYKLTEINHEGDVNFDLPLG